MEALQSSGTDCCSGVSPRAGSPWEFKIGGTAVSRWTDVPARDRRYKNRTLPTKPISVVLSIDMLGCVTYSRLGILWQTPQGANYPRVTHFAISLIGMFALTHDRKSSGSGASSMHCKWRPRSGGSRSFATKCR